MNSPVMIQKRGRTFAYSIRPIKGEGNRSEIRSRAMIESTQFARHGYEVSEREVSRDKFNYFVVKSCTMESKGRSCVPFRLRVISSIRSSEIDV